MPGPISTICPLSIKLFGDTEITVGGEPLPALRTRKGVSLLAILALQHGKPADRRWIAGMLWPDSQEEQSLCNLRRALTDLRAALGPTSDRIVAPTPRSLCLALQAIDYCDYELFQRLTGLDDSEALQRAVEISSSPLLADCDDYWVFAPRETAAQKRAATEAALAAVPERDLAPESETDSVIFQSTSTHEETVRLPRPLTQLIGRSVEVDEIDQALANQRLVTLIGVGGIGKTRLAIESAQAARGRYPQGVWFVDLSGLENVDEVAAFTASYLELIESTTETDTERLTRRIGAGSFLLVLDNCEHVIAGSAALVETLLENCEGLTVLATSREPLNISGEHRWIVPGLQLPTSAPADGAGITPEQLLAFDAARLFVIRGKAQFPGFTVTAQLVPSIIEICRSLDGLPLAIELAAARLSILSPVQIEQRLRDRFKLLTGGSKLAWPRHRTLQAMVEWSYDLLTANEQSLFRRLSIFRGGWILDDLAAAGTGGENSDSLDLFGSLIEKSLIQADAEVEGVRRYRMLESIREYALARLKEGDEWAEISRCHAYHFATVAASQNEILYTRDRQMAFGRISADLDNMRAALEWSICAPGESEFAVRLVNSLSRFWYYRAMFREGLRWIEQAVDVDEPVSPELLSRSYNSAGSMLWAMGQFEAARGYYDTCLKLGREINDPRTIAFSLQNVGLIYMHQGEYKTARIMMEESLGLLRALNDRTLLATPLNNLAIVLKDMGDYDKALELLDESYEINSELGNWQVVLSGLVLRGNLHRRRGNLDEAKACLLEALELGKSAGEPQTTTITCHNLGDMSLQERDFVTARRYYDESLTVAREIGDRRQEATTLCSMAQLNRAEGNLHDYRVMYRESAHMAAAMKERVLMCTLLADLAGQAMERGDIEMIASLSGTIDAASERFGTPINQYNKEELAEVSNFARGKVSAEAYKAAYDAGAEVDLETALENALKSIY